MFNVLILFMSSFTIGCANIFSINSQHKTNNCAVKMCQFLFFSLRPLFTPILFGKVEPKTKKNFFCDKNVVQHEKFMMFLRCLMLDWYCLPSRAHFLLWNSSLFPSRNEEFSTKSKENKIFWLVYYRISDSILAVPESFIAAATGPAVNKMCEMWIVSIKIIPKSFICIKLQ